MMFYVQQLSAHRKLLTGSALCAVIVLQIASLTRAAELAKPAELVQAAPAKAVELDFYRDVYPFLKSNCISCHNKTTTKGDLDMETPEMMKKGGETGQGVVPGKGTESLIVQAARHTEDLEMPPKSNKAGAVNLLPAEIEILKTWIDQGAKSSVQQERQVVWQPLAPGVHPIYSVAMTKDGRFAACGRSNQLFVYDLATRQFVTQIVDDSQKSGVAHRAMVQALAFSPDGTRLASGSFREVKIWRQEKGKVTTRKADATLGAVTSVLTSDGKQIISADKAGALLVLDAASGKVIKKIADVNKSGIKLLSVSLDASKVAVFGADAVLSVWNLPDARLLVTKSVQANLDPAIEAQSKSAQEKLTASVNAEAAALTAVKQAKDAKTAATTEASVKLAAGTAIEAAAAEAAKVAQGQSKAAKEKLTVSAKAEAVALVAVKQAQDAKAVAMKEVSDSEALVAKTPGDASLQKRLKEAQEKLVVRTAAETVAVANATSAQGQSKAAQEKLTASANAEVAALAAVKQAQVAKAAVTTETQVKVAASIKTETAAIEAAKVAQAAKTSAQKAASDAVARATKARDAGVRALTWTSDGKFIITAGEDKIARAWLIPAAGSTEFAAPKELKGATGIITTLLAGPTPDKCITASEDGKVRIWNVSEAKTTQEIASAGILSLGLSQDGKQLATGGADGAVRVWDVASSKQIIELRGSVAASQQMAALDWTIAAQGLEQAFQKTEATRIEAQNKALDELLKKANETIVAVDKVLPEKQKVVKSAQEAKAAADKIVLIAKAAPAAKAAELEKQRKDAQDKLAVVTAAETAAVAASTAAGNIVKTAEAEVKRITDAKAGNSKDLTALDELLKKTNETIVAQNKMLPEKQLVVKSAQEAKAAAQKVVNDVAALIAKASDGKPDAVLEKQLKDAQDKLAVVAVAETAAVAASTAVGNNIKAAEAEVKRITDVKTKNSKDLTALDELLKKANETIVAQNKVLPEKQKAMKSAQDARIAAQKAVDDVAALIAKASDGKPDAVLEKQLKDAQDKLLAATMAEASALAAFSAAESNVKDAKVDVKRITDAKTKNNKDITSANAIIETSKKTQAKATADLAAAKLALTKGNAKPLAVAFSADAQRVAVIFSDGTLNIMAVASGTPVEQVLDSATTTASLIPLANGTFVTCNTGGTTSITSAASRWVLERVLGGEKDHSLFADRVNAVCFSPDGKTLATGGGEPSRSGDISLFDMTTGKLITTWRERHKDIVLSLDFSPNGKLVASGASDKIARVTDIATGKQVNLFEAHTHYVMGVAFRADGRVLATAGADGVVNVWDMFMGERKKKIEGWTKEVTSLQFIGATNQIVTSAGDNLVRIVSDEGAEVRSIAKLPDFMQAAASTATASVVIGGGEDSLLRVWDGTNGKELAAFGIK